MATILWVIGCGPGGDATTASTGDAGTSTAEASVGDVSSGDPGSGAPEVARCGDGVVDPGEVCDDGDGGCDACTDQCTLPVEPEVAWEVALAPMVRVDDVDVTQDGRFYVLGETAAGAPLLHTVEQTGLRHTVDLAALGLTRVLAFHVNGAATDDAEVGILGVDADGHKQAARLGPDGVIGPWLPLADEVSAEHIAVTSAGLTLLNYQDVWRVSPTGVVSGPSESFQSRRLDALGDRLVFMGSGRIVLIDPDGDARVDVPCEGSSLTTSGTHVVWSAGVLGDGDLVMSTCELATGVASSAVIVRGEGGLESGPQSDLRDAAPNGNPIGAWSVCAFGDGGVMGCRSPRERGFGGPGDPRALELDGCDDGATALVAVDGGLYMIRSDQDTGAPRLVRRWTLPDRAPWN